MRLVDSLCDLFRRRRPEPLRTEADRAHDRMLEELFRERREIAEARRIMGGWGGDALAEGLSRGLGVPVVFEPDYGHVVAVRDALRAR